MTLVDVRLGLREFLHDDAGIAAIVGATLASARIYPLVMVQDNVRPCLVYTLVSGLGDHHMQGVGLPRARYQIDAWAKDIDTAVTLSNLVKERLDGYRGTMAYGTNSPQDEIEVLGVFFADEREDYDSEKQMYRVSRDFLIWHRET